MIGCVGVVAVSYEIEVATIDAPAVAEDRLFNLLLVEEASEACVHTADASRLSLRPQWVATSR